MGKPSRRTSWRRQRIVAILKYLNTALASVMVGLYEAELSTKASNKAMVVLDSLTRGSGLWNAFAFDKCDENCKILSCAGTVHDTVGICYQNLLYVTTGDTEKPSLLDGKGKRSGSLRYQEWYLKLYRKRPMMDMFSFIVKEVHWPRELASTERSFR